MNQKGLAPIVIVLILAALGGGAYYLSRTEGKFCGGFAANLAENQCPIGYVCQPEGSYPDASGKCTNIINSYFKKTAPQQTTQSLPTPSQQPTPTPSPVDETTNWKTYTHPQFSFKFPSNWYAEENPEYPGGNNIQFFLMGTEADFGHGNFIGNGIVGFEFSNNNQTLEELKTKYYPNTVNITISGKPALKTVLANPAVYVKLSKNETLSISIWNHDETSSSLDQIFDQMLSTFKFLP